MGRSQLSTRARGGEVFWFECPCSYRWSGGTAGAKRLAYRLHSLKCASLQGVQPMNAEGPGVLRFQENAAISAQRILDQRRAEEQRLHS